MQQFGNISVYVIQFHGKSMLLNWYTLYSCMFCDKYGGYNISVLWNMTTCSLAKIYGRLGGTPVNHCRTSRRHIPECCVHSHRCENLQSRTGCRPVTEVSDVRTDQHEAWRINEQFRVEDAK